MILEIEKTMTVKVRVMPESNKSITERVKEFMTKCPDLCAALEHDDPSLIRDDPPEAKAKK